MLLAAYDTRRPTRDIDPQATHLAGDVETILALVRDSAALRKDDGLVYDGGSATAEVIRDEEAYSGVRVGLIGRLSRARISFTLTSTWATPSVPGQDRSRCLAFWGEPSPFAGTRHPWCSPRRSSRLFTAGRSTPAGATTPTPPCSALSTPEPDG